MANRMVPFVLALAWHISGFAAPVEGALTTITTNDLLKHIQVLAPDEFEGREPGSRGEQRTLDYLLKAFKGMGLRPGNPDGTYFQNVELVGITGERSAALTAGGKPLEIFLPRDCVIW